MTSKRTSNGKGEGEGNGEMRGFFAGLRMTLQVWSVMTHMAGNVHPTGFGIRGRKLLERAKKVKYGELSEESWKCKRSFLV
jgi:hypothetical protein